MSDVTQILAAIEQGDAHAAERLLPLVYDELRKLAGQKMAQEKPGQTLQATALVHEAYVRLVDTETRDHDDLTVTDSMLRRYRRAFEDFSTELRRYSMRYSIGYARARTDVAFDAFLLQILQRGGLVA